MPQREAELRQQIQKLQQDIRLPAYDHTDSLSTKALLAPKMSELRRLLGQHEAHEAAVEANREDQKQIEELQGSGPKVIARRFDPEQMKWSGDC